MGSGICAMHYIGVSALHYHRLCRQRPHAFRDTTDSGCLPPLADPSSEPPQNVTAAKTFNRVFARHSVALCTREQNSKNDDNDCGLSPKRLDELRPKTDGEVSREKQPEPCFGWRFLFEILEVLQHLSSVPLQIRTRVEFQKQSIDCQRSRRSALFGLCHRTM